MVQQSALDRIATGILWVIALFYGYGALVHVANILGLSGFDWSSAPRKWQLLDVVYLVLDLIVVIGFFAKWKPSYVVFYLTATSQIVLYNVLRAWLLDVPADFAVDPEGESDLNDLIAFHAVALVLVTVALRLRGSDPRTGVT